MGFRFRKSVRILPGVRINISKSGISTTVGTRGASVNVSKRGTRGTVGIPGSGMSYSRRLTGAAGTRGGRGLLLVIAVIILIALFR